jgi:hypothetical protein
MVDYASKYSWFLDKTAQAEIAGGDRLKERLEKNNIITTGTYHVTFGEFNTTRENVPELTEAYPQLAQLKSQREYLEFVKQNPAVESQIAGAVFERRSRQFNTQSDNLMAVDLTKLPKQTQEAVLLFSYNTNVRHPKMRRYFAIYTSLPDNHPMKKAMLNAGIGQMTIGDSNYKHTDLKKNEPGNMGLPKRYFGLQNYARGGDFLTPDEAEAQAKKQGTTSKEKIRLSEIEAESTFENYKAFITSPQPEQSARMLKEPSLPEYHTAMQEPEFPPEATYP